MSAVSRSCLRSQSPPRRAGCVRVVCVVAGGGREGGKKAQGETTSTVEVLSCHTRTAPSYEPVKILWHIVTSTVTTLRIEYCSHTRKSCQYPMTFAAVLMHSSGAASCPQVCRNDADWGRGSVLSR